MAYVNPNLRVVHSTLNPAAKVFEYKPRKNDPKKVANVKPNMRKMPSSLDPYAKVFVYKFKDESSISQCQVNTDQSLLVYYQPAPHIYPIINGHIVKLVDCRTGAPLVGPNDDSSTPLLVYPQSADYPYDESLQLSQYAFETIPYRPPYFSCYPEQQLQLQQQEQAPQQQQVPLKPAKPKRRSRRGKKKRSQQELINACQTQSRGTSVYQSLLGLIANLKEPISYAQIVDELAQRLQRPQIEIQRMAPAALHQAILQGYIRKLSDGSASNNNVQES